jgi:hypothetical protein
MNLLLHRDVQAFVIAPVDEAQSLPVSLAQWGR